MLKIEKRKLFTKKWFSIFLSLSNYNSSNRTQNLKRSNKNISYENSGKVKYQIVFFVA